MAEQTEKGTPVGEPELFGKIRKQIEFYFGDSNFARDRFLREESGKSEEGFVSLDVIAKFKRIESLTTRMDDIVNSLGGSTVVTLSDDKKSVRRIDPLPERDDFKKRTCYVKPLSLDATIESVWDFFEKIGVTVRSVRLRRNQQKEPTGAAFVEFSTVEEAQKMAEKKDLGCFGSVEENLRVELKADYFKRKKLERAMHVAEGKQMVEGKSKQKNESSEKQNAEEKDLSFVKGAVLHVAGIGEKGTREELKDVWPLAFVNYERGEAEAHVAFQVENAAVEALSQFTARKLGGGEIDVTVRLVEGDEEREYWQKVEDLKAERRSKPRKGKRGPRSEQSARKRERRS